MNNSIHLNPIQEAIQHGDLDFTGVAEKLELLCTQMADQSVPVFAREVCFGISSDVAWLLIDCGVSGIDCAGGTSWAMVESYCAKRPRRKALGRQFGEWGIPTAQSIQNV